MEKGYMESEIRVNGIWFSLAKYREMKAERRRELVKGVAFIVLMLAVMFALLWGLP